MAADGPGSQKLLYALIARNDNVLAEAANAASSAASEARRVLQKLDSSATRASYTQDRLAFHVLQSSGITYLCVASDSTAVGRRIPFAFLDEVAAKFAAPTAKMDEFGPYLRALLEKYSVSPNVDAINRVKGELAEVKTIMLDNIDRVLERGEHLELLVDKTEQLSSSAFSYRRSARALGQQLWLNHVKFIALAVVVAALFSYFVAALVCGVALHCKN